MPFPLYNLQNKNFQAGAYVMTGLPLTTYLQDMRKFAGQLKLCMQDWLLCYAGASFRAAQILASTADGDNKDGKNQDESSVVTWKSLEVQIFITMASPSKLV